MAGLVWFGTRSRMQWVPAPAVDVPSGKVGYEAGANFLNGGAYVRRSKASAKKFSLSWNMKHRDDIRPILDYADGLYGDGYIYYANPFAMDKNMLPAYWATPFINGYDGPLLVDGARPTLSSSAYTNGYPVQSATYAVSSSGEKPSIYIPIPPGYRAHVGIHGAVVSGGARVVISELVLDSPVNTVTATLLGKSGALTNFISASGTEAITLTINASTSGSIRLDGLIVQVLPEGSVSPVGEFISGQGTSGMSFASQPAVSEYSAALDRVGVSADLIETEAWA